MSSRQHGLYYCDYVGYRTCALLLNGEPYDNNSRNGSSRYGCFDLALLSQVKIYIYELGSNDTRTAQTPRVPTENLLVPDIYTNNMAKQSL